MVAKGKSGPAGMREAADTLNEWDDSRHAYIARLHRYLPVGEYSERSEGVERRVDGAYG